MFEYQKENLFFAQVTGQMEEMCEQELIALGATNTRPVYRGIYFNAEKADLYKIIYTSRLITRVLAPLTSFYAKDTDALRRTAFKFSWDDFLSLKDTFAITASVSNSKITHSKYAALCLKDSIADYFTAKKGKRPNVETKSPDVRFNLHIDRDQAVVSLDVSGESLHKRGYRLLAGEAPMQETLAAAMVNLSYWNGDVPLGDFMCGSGTILCEALMHYCKIPAQYLRTNFGFFNLPDFDKELWKKVKEAADKEIRPLPKGLIFGSDKSIRAIEVARENLDRLPHSGNIELFTRSFQEIENFENGVIITNPPYGIRIGEKEEAQILFKEFGDFIKQKCNGTSAFIYSGDPGLRKHIGLKTSKRIPLVNGKLEGVLFQIDSFKGTHKEKMIEKYKGISEQT
ncbi:MAG: class I SAM-dependent RNA methyltransferase [Bacteroidetes bacterium]|nr:class I SAM-dependent RNA methyltransferase [Bacteroidota bacterium]